MRLAVRLTPRGGRDAIDGWAADAAGRPMLRARVAAPPAEGAANAALVRLIAKALAIAPSSVRIASGAASRTKQLEIAGVSEAALARAFGAPPR